jgi:hypothetical protein
MVLRTLVLTGSCPGPGDVGGVGAMAGQVYGQGTVSDGWREESGFPPEAEPPPGRGIGMRLLSGVVSFFLFAGGYWAYDWWRSANRDDSGEVTTAGLVWMEDLRLGDCFDDATWLTEITAGTGEDGEVESVSATPCAEPHDFEVYHVADLSFDDEAAFPGDDILVNRADSEICYPTFRPFVGQRYEDSELDFAFFWPTKESWDSGVRTVQCVIFALDGSQLTGTARDSGR